MTLQVVKIGGSLWTLPDLPQRLHTWLNQQPPAPRVLLNGGGALADVIRETEARFAFSSETSHWLCVDVLGVSANLLAAMSPQAGRAERLAEVRTYAAQWAEDSPPLIFHPVSWLKETPAEILPRSWDAATDSIAARLAEALSAELVLLKSADPPASGENSDYTDAYFSLASAALAKTRAVNLRGFQEEKPQPGRDFDE